MRRPRIWLGCLVLVGVAACSGGGGAPDASGNAGASGGGGGAAGAGGQAGASTGGGAGGQAGGSAGRGGTTGAGGQAGGGGTAGAGGQVGASAGTGGRGGTGGTAGSGGRGGVGGQAGGSAGAGGRGGGGGSGGDVCPLLAGMTFRSVTEQECGRGPDGGARCRWVISFRSASMFDWQHSDYAETGTYSCSGTMVTGNAQTKTVTAQYDAASQILTWDDLAYTPQ
jgi:hypothetical protein